MTDKEEVEVILRKKMTYSDYKRIIQQSKDKGWDIKAYQIGFYSPGQQKEIKP